MDAFTAIIFSLRFLSASGSSFGNVNKVESSDGRDLPLRFVRNRATVDKKENRY